MAGRYLYLAILSRSHSLCLWVRLPERFRPPAPPHPLQTQHLNIKVGCVSLSVQETPDLPDRMEPATTSRGPGGASGPGWELRTYPQRDS